MGIARVILIGGASLAGKTTLSLALSARLKYACFSTDDIGTALHAITTPESHPNVHARRGSGSAQYYLETPLERLMDDDQQELAAIWPAAASIIRQHATWRCPAVIEGIALLPDRVAAARFSNVTPLWLEIDESLLRERLRCDVDFLRWSKGDAKLLDRFVRRSARYNQIWTDVARRAGFRMMQVRDGVSSGELCDEAMRLVTLPL